MSVRINPITVKSRKVPKAQQRAAERQQKQLRQWVKESAAELINISKNKKISGETLLSDMSIRSTLQSYASDIERGQSVWAPWSINFKKGN